MKNRHDLDDKVFEFLTKSFRKDFQSDSSLYKSQVGNIKIKIWKHQFSKAEKVDIFIAETPTDSIDNIFSEALYRLDFDKSELLRKFFESLEDEKNQAELINNHKELEEIMKKGDI